MELRTHVPALNPAAQVEVLEWQPRAAGGAVDPAWTRWQAQPWRHQLRRPEDYARPLERKAVVELLLREGLTPAAELAWLAGGLEAASHPRHLTIQQVVRFTDSLTERIARASMDELVQVTYLQRNAVGLANRMIDWANASRL